MPINNRRIGIGSFAFNNNNPSLSTDVGLNPSRFGNNRTNRTFRSTNLGTGTLSGSSGLNTSVGIGDAGFTSRPRINSPVVYSSPIASSQRRGLRSGIVDYLNNFYSNLNIGDINNRFNGNTTFQDALNQAQSLNDETFFDPDFIDYLEEFELENDSLRNRSRQLAQGLSPIRFSFF